MSINLPGDPNLPPGVTQKMIDRQFAPEEEGPRYCEECDIPLPEGLDDVLCKECREIDKADHLRDRDKDAEAERRYRIAMLDYADDQLCPGMQNELSE